MLPKNTMMDVALKLAEEMILKRCDKLDSMFLKRCELLDSRLDNMFLKRCELLDSRLASSLKEAFSGEKISQVRMQRIVDRFCDNMLDSKKTDKSL